MGGQSLNKHFPKGGKCQGRENTGYISRGTWLFIEDCKTSLGMQ